MLIEDTIKKLSIISISLGLLFVCITAINTAPIKVCPVVAIEFENEGYLIGGTIDKKWVSAEKISQYLTGNTSYKIYSNKQLEIESIGSKPKKDDYHYIVSFSEITDNCILAIGGNWNTMPRIPKSLSVNDKAYRNTVKMVLNEKKLYKSVAEIKQILKIDLDRDGIDEVLIFAESKNFDPYTYKQGEYSFVFLRKIVNQKVKNIIICGDFHVNKKSVADIEYYNYGGLWDVDGDGNLEIGVNWCLQSFDVGGMAIYDVDNNKVKLLAKDGIGH